MGTARPRLMCKVAWSTCEVHDLQHSLTIQGIVSPSFWQVTSMMWVTHCSVAVLARKVHEQFGSSRVLFFLCNFL